MVCFPPGIGGWLGVSRSRLSVFPWDSQADSVGRASCPPRLRTPSDRLNALGCTSARGSPDRPVRLIRGAAAAAPEVASNAANALAAATRRISLPRIANPLVDPALVAAT